MTKRFRNLFLALSAIYVVLGLAMVIWPLSSRTIICYVAGAAAIVYGAYRMITYFTKSKNDVLQFGFVAGLLSLLAGIMFVFRPSLMVMVYGIVAGAAVICDSVLKLQLALEFKRLNTNYWVPSLVLALVLLAAGILMIFDPFASAAAMTIYMGICLIIDALVNVWVILEAKKYIKYID